MNFSSLLLTASLVIFISVSYLVAVRYLKHREAAAGRFGVIGRRWPRAANHGKPAAVDQGR